MHRTNTAGERIYTVMWTFKRSRGGFQKSSRPDLLAVQWVRDNLLNSLIFLTAIIGSADRIAFRVTIWNVLTMGNCRKPEPNCRGILEMGYYLQ